MQSFQSPTGMCMADHGRVAYVFDTTNFLRRIDLDGTINAHDPPYVANIVGHGVGGGTSRDGAYDRQDGDYYHAPYLGDSNSKLMPQDCVTTASGSFLYFIEGAGICHRVRQLNLDTRVVESIAGTVVPSHPVNQKGYQDGIGTNAVFFFRRPSLSQMTARRSSLRRTSALRTAILVNRSITHCGETKSAQWTWQPAK